MSPEENKLMQVSIPMFNDILKYLASRPWQEVNQLLMAIDRDLKEIAKSDPKVEELKPAEAPAPSAEPA